MVRRVRVVVHQPFERFALRVAHRMLQLGHLRAEGEERSEGGHRLRHDSMRRVEPRFLRQIRHTHPARQCDRARLSMLDARDDP